MVRGGRTGRPLPGRYTPNRAERVISTGRGGPVDIGKWSHRTNAFRGPRHTAMVSAERKSAAYCQKISSTTIWGSATRGRNVNRIHPR